MPRTYSISSEHSFCRAHTNALIWSLDSFLRLLIKRQKSLTDTVSDDERKHVTTRATTPDNAWQQVTTNYNEWTLQLNFSFFKNEKVICYYTRCELLQPVVVEDLFKIHINLSTGCHSLWLHVQLTCLRISDPTELYRKYTQLTTEHCNEMWSITSAVHVHFIWSKTFYNLDLLNTYSLFTFLKLILFCILFIGKSWICWKLCFYKSVTKVLLNLQKEPPEW